jgi:hypothetical protein
MNIYALRPQLCYPSHKPSFHTATTYRCRDSRSEKATTSTPGLEKHQTQCAAWWPASEVVQQQRVRLQLWPVGRGMANASEPSTQFQAAGALVQRTQKIQHEFVVDPSIKNNGKPRSRTCGCAVPGGKAALTWSESSRGTYRTAFLRRNCTVLHDTFSFRF